MAIRDILIILVPTMLVTSFVTYFVVSSPGDPIACPVCVECNASSTLPARDFAAEVKKRGTKIGNEEGF